MFFIDRLPSPARAYVVVAGRQLAVAAADSIVAAVVERIEREFRQVGRQDARQEVPVDRQLVGDILAVVARTRSLLN